jgi:NAD(P)H dehydrogenase (quinone)
MTTYAITGAAGPFGRAAIASLLITAPASDIVAIVRTEARAAELSDLGVQTRIADYAHPEAVAEALVGVDKLLLVSGTEFGSRLAQHSTIIDAAVANGVSFVVYTSAPKADATTLVVAPEHKATEEYIRASGLAFSFVRNAWYNENYLGVLAAAKESGQVVTTVTTGRVASAARADYAEAAVVVLTSEAPVDEVYELSGDHAWTWPELTDDISALLGKPVTLTVVSADELRELSVASGAPEGAAEFAILMDQNIEDGLLGVENGVLGGLLGRPTTPIRETLAAAV